MRSAFLNFDNAQADLTLNQVRYMKRPSNLNRAVGRGSGLVRDGLLGPHCRSHAGKEVLTIQHPIAR